MGELVHGRCEGPVRPVLELQHRAVDPEVDVPHEGRCRQVLPDESLLVVVASVYDVVLPLLVRDQLQDWLVGLDVVRRQREGALVHLIVPVSPGRVHQGRVRLPHEAQSVVARAFRQLQLVVEGLARIYVVFR